MRYLGAAIIAGLPHPWSISRYRLIDKNPTLNKMMDDRGTITADRLITCWSIGPLKFIVYAPQMQEVISRRGVSFYGFTDDSQLVNHMLVNEMDARKNAIIDCITDIELWCRSHGLKLNADKSDVIWLGSRQQLAKLSQADKDVHLSSGSLRASETVHNLGVIFDQHLTFEAQACACSKACFYHLWRIRQIRRFIDDSSLKLLVQAFITTRLDYCNGLLANCSVAVRKRMQDRAARWKSLIIWNASAGCRKPDAKRSAMDRLLKDLW